MKKLICGICAVCMMAAMSVTSFAASPITAIGGSDSKAANGTYVPGSSSTVYKVDVEWGTMNFTYTGASSGTWNPDTHQFSGSSTAGWSWDNESNKITVTNHSNAAVEAQFAYSSTISGLVGGFYTTTKGTTALSGNKLNLADASVGSSLNTPANAPKGNAYFQVTGGSITTNGLIATITVTLH